LPTRRQGCAHHAQQYPAGIDPFGLQGICQLDKIVPPGKIVMGKIARAHRHALLHAVAGNNFLGK
jgi:hypothetical protein